MSVTPTPPVDDKGHPRVDFVWGNMPTQPDTERGANTLNPALDNHNIAKTGYQGYPGFAANTGTPLPLKTETDTEKAGGYAGGPDDPNTGSSDHPRVTTP